MVRLGRTNDFSREELMATNEGKEFENQSDRYGRPMDLYKSTDEGDPEDPQQVVGAGEPGFIRVLSPDVIVPAFEGDPLVSKRVEEYKAKVAREADEAEQRLHDAAYVDVDEGIPSAASTGVKLLPGEYETGSVKVSWDETPAETVHRGGLKALMPFILVIVGIILIAGGIITLFVATNDSPRNYSSCVKYVQTLKQVSSGDVTDKKIGYMRKHLIVCSEDDHSNVVMPVTKACRKCTDKMDHANHCDNAHMHTDDIEYIIEHIKVCNNHPDFTMPDKVCDEIDKDMRHVASCSSSHLGDKQKIYRHLSICDKHLK